MYPDDKKSGHMWVVTTDKRGRERIVEATAPSSRLVVGVYAVEYLFNDQYAFASEKGIKDFDLLPVPLGAPATAEEIAVGTK
jgi:hypothetical protein